jgi:hypothetical protein
VNAALKAVGWACLDAHVRHCVRESIEQERATKGRRADGGGGTSGGKVIGMTTETRSPISSWTSRA